MKIALCVEYPIGQFGGTEVLARELIHGLCATHEIILVSPDDASSIKSSGIADGLRGHVPWQPRAVSPATSQALARQLADQGVQLAHFHQGGNYGWGNRFPNHAPMAHLDRLGVPCCTTVHLVVNLLDGYCGPAKPLAFKLAMLPLAWTGKLHALAHVRREIAVSQHDFAKLRRWYFPLRHKFTQIYHSRLKDAPPRVPAAQREPLILNVGHVAARKGQLVLAEAFARVAPKYPEWKLQLIGAIDEPEIGEKIRQLAREQHLEDRITLAGARNDAMQWMDRAAIYVQPSLREALGLALQEAMYRGCPSIGARAGGIPELVRHEKTGLLVEPGDAAQLARALEAFLSSPELREKYSRAGAEFIREQGMTSAQMVANHVRLYAAVLSGDTSK